MPTPASIITLWSSKIEMFPSNIVAGLFRFEKRSMYLVDDAAQRENVKVEF